MKATSLLPTLTGVTALAALTGCGGQTAKPSAQGPSKPMNILYIMCDDHSYQTISA